MKTDIIVLDPKEYGLETAQVATIEQAFLPKIQERDALAVIYNELITSEITPELCKQAREVRLKAVKVRTGILAIHKTQKEFFLAAGRFVDAWKNKETLPVTQMEEKLTEIEDYYANIERERIAALQVQRNTEVIAYTEHPASDLGNMSDDVYTAYLSGLKVAHEARIQAELKAELERLEAEHKIELNRVRKEKTIRLVEYIDNYESVDFGSMSEDEFMAVVNAAIEQRTAHEAEQARIKADLAAAKAEADRKEKEIAIERKKQADALEAQRKESERIQAEKDAENAKLQAELKVIADKEAAIEKARIEADNAAKAEAAKAAKAPRKQKLQKWVDGFSIEAYENDATAAEITAKFEAFKKWASEQVGKI